MPTLIPSAGIAIAQARINVREGSPSVAARIARQILAGGEFAVVAVTKGDLVAGIDDWYAGAGDEFVWAGAVRLHDGGLTAGDGPRYPDGNRRPLTVDQVRAAYGAFDYREAAGGAIVPDPAWTRSNIRALSVPQAFGGRGLDMWVHVRAAPAFERVFAELAAAGLLDRLLTYDGSYVPRHKGWDRNRGLSSHSWGIAVDFNARWNGYGQEPAPMGGPGSVRELVPIWAAAGFAWGGHFQTAGQRDGMHFELALQAPAAAAPIVVQPTPAAPTPLAAAAATGALAFEVAQETIDGQRYWTFNDPASGVKRQAGKVVAYSLSHPATGAKVTTRGLSRYGGFGHEPAPRYVAADWRPAFGYWADFLQATAEGESRRHFTCVNSYDRAAFTFGCFQYAAHTPGQNLIRLFRSLLQLDEAGRYFPDLALSDDGRVCVREGDQLLSLEGAAPRADGLGRAEDQGRFMDYLNGAMVSADAEEARAAARLISWATDSGAHRQAQVALAVDLAGSLLADTHGRLGAIDASLDGAPIGLCAMVFDIRHQGRKHPAHTTVVRGLAAALAAARPMDVLCEFGAASHGPRIEAVRQVIESVLAAPALAGLRYDASSGGFA